MAKTLVTLCLNTRESSTSFFNYRYFRSESNIDCTKSLAIAIQNNSARQNVNYLREIMQNPIFKEIAQQFLWFIQCPELKLIIVTPMLQFIPNIGKNIDTECGIGLLSLEDLKNKTLKIWKYVDLLDQCTAFDKVMQCVTCARQSTQNCIINILGFDTTLPKGNFNLGHSLKDAISTLRRIFTKSTKFEFVTPSIFSQPFRAPWITPLEINFAKVREYEESRRRAAQRARDTKNAKKTCKDSCVFAKECIYVSTNAAKWCQNDARSKGPFSEQQVRNAYENFEKFLAESRRTKEEIYFIAVMAGAEIVINKKSYVLGRMDANLHHVMFYNSRTYEPHWYKYEDAIKLLNLPFRHDNIYYCLKKQIARIKAAYSPAEFEKILFLYAEACQYDTLFFRNGGCFSPLREKTICQIYWRPYFPNELTIICKDEMLRVRSPWDLLARCYTTNAIPKLIKRFMQA